MSGSERVSRERVTGWTGSGQFTLPSRILHWTMAAMILTMLFVGVAMVASLADYHLLISIHRPLGIAILVLVVIRFANRLLTPTRGRVSRRSLTSRSDRSSAPTPRTAATR